MSRRIVSAGKEAGVKSLSSNLGERIIKAANSFRVMNANYREIDLSLNLYIWHGEGYSIVRNKKKRIFLLETANIIIWK
ncbi:hypothetical protein [Leptospira perolatii]|uniref:hypothetical protein n=1 Tax=Leptospira perolatii TaxID=2023191 RepID=UPI0013FDBFBD|nr:hypothetical protein [Leptospira perolatii]